MQLFVSTQARSAHSRCQHSPFIGFGSAAMAADANAVANRIKALYAKQGGELSFSGVKANGADIILEGASLKLPTVSEDETVLGDVTLQNVERRPRTAVIPSSRSVPRSRFQRQGRENTAGPRSRARRCRMFLFRPETTKGPLDSMVLYDKTKIDEAHFGAPGKNGTTLKGIDASLDTSNKTEKIGYIWESSRIST